MVFVLERKIKGNKYLYIENSFRIGKKILKLSKFIGRKEDISKSNIDKAMKDFALDLNDKIVDERIKLLQHKLSKFEYPITIEEIKEIERENLIYYEILKNLHKKDKEDLKKRFIANFVFESNAIEGNSLTLKNYQEIIFEKRITKSSDLREIYDAENSYKTFSWLFSIRKELSEELVIEIHKRIIKNIDTRIGYKKIPNILLGRNLELCKPEKVKEEMENLIIWYSKNKESMYPLELAFKFHHKFEKIHPFADGNGRVGRMLLNYILIHEGYFPIIIRKTQRQKYLKSLEAADTNIYIPLMKLALECAKITYKNFFEVYYKYTKIKK